MNWWQALKKTNTKKRESSSSTLTNSLFDLERKITINDNDARPSDILKCTCLFADATPALEEVETYERLQKSVIVPMEKAKRRLKYEIKPAKEDGGNFTNAPQNTQYDKRKATKAVLPAVNIMHMLYQITLEIDMGVTTILQELFKNEPDPISISSLNKNPGLTKLFADILAFAYDFDNFKLDNPTIYNDFALYKRMLQIGKSDVTDNDESMSAEEKEAPSQATGEMSNSEDVHKVSMALANPTPMTRYIIDAVIRCSIMQHQKANSNQLVSAKKSLCEWLQNIWRVSYVALNIKKSRLKKAAKNTQKITADDEQAQALDCARIEYLVKVMIQSILVYDCLNPGGAFQKKTPILAKESLNLLLYFHLQQGSKPKEPGSLGNLVTVLFYNSQHVKDKTTSKSIRNMINQFLEKKQKR